MGGFEDERENVARRSNGYPRSKVRQVISSNFSFNTCTTGYYQRIAHFQRIIQTRRESVGSYCPVYKPPVGRVPEVLSREE